MNVQNIRAEKETLEKAMLRLLQQFQEKTTILVDEVLITNSDDPGTGGETYQSRSRHDYFLTVDVTRDVWLRWLCQGFPGAASATETQR